MTRRSSEDWQALIEEQQTSGLNQTQFCKQQGLNSKYFSIRKGKLAAEKRSSSFVKAKRPSDIETVTKPLAKVQFGDVSIQLEAATPQFIAELARWLT